MNAIVKKLVFRLKKSPTILMKFVATAVLFLTVLLLSEIFISSRFYDVSYEEHVETARGDFTNCFENINKFEERLTHLSFLFQTDETVIGILTHMDEYSTSEYQRATLKVIPKLYQIQDGSEEYFCRVYVNSSVNFMDTTSRVLPMNQLNGKEWAKELMSGWGNWKFFSADEIGQENPVLAVPIRDLKNYSRLVALLMIDMDPESLAEKIEAPRSHGYVTCYLQTADGQIVAASNQQEKTYSLEAPEETLDGFESFQTNTVMQDNNTVFYRTLPNSNWRLIMVVDHQKLHDSIFPQLAALTILGCVLAGLGLLCAMPILFSTISHIRRFHQYVLDYSHSPLQGIPPSLEPMSKDEIGQLIEAHNALLRRIRELVKDRNCQEKELRRLEVSVLQEQINPHFLYNTLEAIIWMAKLNQPEKVEETIRNMTRYYRLCLSKGKSVLTVSQELEIVKNYFAIQSVRYEKPFQFFIEVPEEMLELDLPKITLQPLVENALIHGLLESGKPEGWIRISGEIKDGKARLFVRDSGAHFSQETWEKALHAETAQQIRTSGSGYGLHNVERRLCLFFQKSRVMYLDQDVKDETCIVIPFF